MPVFPFIALVRRAPIDAASFLIKINRSRGRIAIKLCRGPDENVATFGDWSDANSAPYCLNATCARRPVASRTHSCRCIKTRVRVVDGVVI